MQADAFGQIGEPDAVAVARDLFHQREGAPDPLDAAARRFARLEFSDGGLFDDGRFSLTARCHVNDLPDCGATLSLRFFDWQSPFHHVGDGTAGLPTFVWQRNGWGGRIRSQLSSSCNTLKVQTISLRRHSV